VSNLSWCISEDGQAGFNITEFNQHDMTDYCDGGVKKLTKFKYFKLS